jgi:hypothetical protein
MPIESYPEDLVIQETPDGLVITYRGSQNPVRALISLISAIFAPVILLVLITSDLASAKPIEFEFDPLTVLCLGSMIFIFAYGTYIALSWALDLMLDRELITITATNLTVEKSGFGPIHLSREFLLKESDCLHLMFMFTGHRITLSPSRLLARIGQMGTGRDWLFTSPMRWFCRGLSREELIAILTRIKSKFPNIKVLMENDPIVGPG